MHDFASVLACFFVQKIFKGIELGCGPEVEKN
jgi:hypothetical protein